MPAKKKESSKKPETNPQSYVQSGMSTFVMILAFVGLMVLGWFAYEEGKYPSDLSELPLIKKNPKAFKVKPENPGGLQISNQNKKIYNIASDGSEKIDAEKESKYAKLLPPPEEPITKEEIESTKYSRLPTDVKNIIDENTASRVKKYRLTSKKSKKLSDYLDKGKSSINIGKTAETSNNEDWDNISDNITAEISAINNPSTTKQSTNSNIPPLQKFVSRVFVTKSKKTGRKVIKLSAIPNKPSLNNINSKKYKADSYKNIKKNANAVMRINAIKGIRIQLGSFESISNLQQNWQIIRNKFKTHFKGLDYNIEKIDLGIKGIFYRLQAGTIRNIAKAEKLCDFLTRKGQPCFVIRAK